VIQHGVTGFICDDADEMTEAVDRIDEIDPEACRRDAERFSADRMCRGYVDVYRSLVKDAARDTVRGPGQHVLPDIGKN